MSDTKVIAVTGATGAQGGGVVRAILADTSGSFAARAITRNPGSDRAKALAAAGVEVVAADLDDPESLERAFAGAAGAFCVTNFWEHFSPEKETAQGQNLARAAKNAGVAHVVWSTFEDTRDFVPLADERMPTLMGHYKVPHFDSKAAANQAFASLGVPTTFLLTSFYWDNLIHFGMGPQKGPDGVYGITMPMGAAKLPGIAAGDIGPCAFGIFQRGESLIGQSVGIAGEHLSGTEMAAALEKALGFRVRYNDVPAEVYRGFGFPGAEDLGNMFQFKRDFNESYCAVRDVERSRSLNPGLQSFASWLEANAGRIPIT
ncbi:MAG: NmrA family NAD(P)-binding protein [Myxococcales bacterium]|nr:NmrA family NAD(P)-binding protein [Myxococcales bacterium]